MMNSEKIGNRIQSIREQRRMSASELARLVHVTPTAVWNWEKNGTRPRQGVLSSIAQVLGVSNEFLLSGKAGAPTRSATVATVAEIIEIAKSQIAKITGLSPESVRVHVELQPNVSKNGGSSEN